MKKASQKTQKSIEVPDLDMANGKVQAIKVSV
jgi:hypothetical protein